MPKKYGRYIRKARRSGRAYKKNTRYTRKYGPIARFRRRLRRLGGYRRMMNTLPESVFYFNVAAEEHLADILGNAHFNHPVIASTLNSLANAGYTKGNIFIKHIKIYLTITNTLHNNAYDNTYYSVGKIFTAMIKERKTGSWDNKHWNNVCLPTHTNNAVPPVPDNWNPSIVTDYAFSHILSKCKIKKKTMGGKFNALYSTSVATNLAPFRTQIKYSLKLNRNFDMRNLDAIRDYYIVAGHLLSAYETYANGAGGAASLIMTTQVTYKGTLQPL